MRSFPKSSACRVIFCFALIVTPLMGRTVRGTVTDSGGKPVVGAAVRLKNAETLRIRSARTGDDGTYRFAGLNPQVDYELRASHKGRSSGWIRVSQFDEGAERIVDLQLK